MRRIHLQELLLSATTTPIIRIQSILQVQNVYFGSGKFTRLFNGFLDCGQEVIKQEGVLSLWRGYTAQIAQYFISVATSGLKRKAFYELTASQGLDATISYQIVNVGYQILSIPLVYPFELAASCLLSDTKIGSGSYRFKNEFDVWKQTINNGSILSLYSGAGANILEVLIGGTISAAVFSLYNTFLTSLRENMDAVELTWLNLSFGRTLVALSTLAGYPFQTVQKQMAIQPEKYSNSIVAVRQISKNQGAKSLWNGALAIFLKSVVGFSIASVQQLLR
jgi:solute carrier family 25 (adenine nucleotide translocator) protein 4/5/6/31